MERGQTENTAGRRRLTVILLLIAAAFAVSASIYFLQDINRGDVRDAGGGGARVPATANPGSSIPVSAVGITVSAMEANSSASNMGFVLEAGEYVYCADFMNPGLTMQPVGDGEGRTLDPDPCYYIGMAGGLIYYYVPGDPASSYGEIRRMAPDGTGREVFAEAPGILSSMHAGEERIYFSVSEPEEAAGLYGIPPGEAGAVAVKITDGAVGMVNAGSGRVFFRRTDMATGGAVVMSASPDGADARVVCESPDGGGINFYIVSEDGHIYFSDSGRRLYRADASGSGEKIILEADADVGAFSLSDGKLYVVTIRPSGDESAPWHERVTEYSPDGKKAGVVADGLMNGTPVGIAGGNVYYFVPGRAGGDSAILQKTEIDETGEEVH
jgi:hypothetical protein